MKTSRDFICLSYKYTDYLIEKKLIAGSLYLEQKNQNLSSLNSELFDKNISVINLDTLISQSFFDAGVSKEKMLIRLNDFFLETTAQAFVKTIPLDQFKMFGTLMDAFFQKKGLIAIRYLENGRVQYLLDINQFINNFKVHKK